MNKMTPGMVRAIAVAAAAAQITGRRRCEGRVTGGAAFVDSIAVGAGR